MRNQHKRFGEKYITVTGSKKQIDNTLSSINKQNITSA